MSIHRKSQRNTSNTDQFADQNADQNNVKSAIPFTHLTIKHLKAESKRKIFWCEYMAGFGIRISPKGIKAWIYQFRIDGKERRMTLGKFPQMSLGEATRAYLENKVKVENGFDPLEERNEKKNKWKNEITVRELIEIYISHCRKTKKKTVKEEERSLHKDVPVDIKAMKISEVPSKKLSNAIDEIIDRGALSMADHFYRYIRHMFNFAIDKGLIENNPCSKIKVRVPKPKRQRHLDLKEVYLFWHNLEKIPMSDVKRLMFKFLLCTVTRPTDIQHMKWSHVNLEQKIWTLPTTKNGILHRVYLDYCALEVLKEVKAYTGDYELVFGSAGRKVLKKKCNDRTKALKPYSKGTLAQSARRHFKKFNIQQSFYPYDLRRTGATMIAGLFGRRDFATMALNHTTSDVTGIYDQYTYDREKKMMLNALNKAIDLVINSPNVESIPDFETLRKQIIQPVESLNLQSLKLESNPMDFQATFSSPVTYRLSFCQNDSSNVV